MLKWHSGHQMVILHEKCDAFAGSLTMGAPRLKTK